MNERNYYQLTRCCPACLFVPCLLAWLGWYSLFTEACHTRCQSALLRSPGERQRSGDAHRPSRVCSLRACQPSARRAAQQVTVRNPLNPRARSISQWISKAEQTHASCFKSLSKKEFRYKYICIYNNTCHMMSPYFFIASNGNIDRNQLHT